MSQTSIPDQEIKFPVVPKGVTAEVMIKDETYIFVIIVPPEEVESLPWEKTWDAGEYAGNARCLGYRMIYVSKEEFIREELIRKSLKDVPETGLNPEEILEPEPQAEKIEEKSKENTSFAYVDDERFIRNIICSFPENVELSDLRTGEKMVSPFSSPKALRLIRKGEKLYLAFILDARLIGCNVEDWKQNALLPHAVRKNIH